MVDSETRLLGVMGHPIRHSMSPLMHNTVFRKLKLNCAYFAFNVPEGKLRDFMKGAEAMDFAGLNVTIPHKVSVMKYLDETSKEASLIGAVNTIKFNKGKLQGYNTDGLGCVRALEESGVKVKGKRILIIGAGGAARAISFQCLMGGARELTVSNRLEDYDRAVELGRDLKVKLGKDVEILRLDDVDKRVLDSIDVLIHATPVGMHPKVNESIIPAKIIPKHLAVMDIVYNPVETKLLHDAAKKGCKTIDGVGMFVHQGAEALKIWFNIKNPPVKLMRETVVGKLTGV